MRFCLGDYYTVNHSHKRTKNNQKKETNEALLYYTTVSKKHKKTINEEEKEIKLDLNIIEDKNKAMILEYSIKNVNIIE